MFKYSSSYISISCPSRRQQFVLVNVTCNVWTIKGARTQILLARTLHCFRAQLPLVAASGDAACSSVALPDRNAGVTVVGAGLSAH